MLLHMPCNLYILIQYIWLILIYNRLPTHKHNLFPLDMSWKSENVIIQVPTLFYESIQMYKRYFFLSFFPIYLKLPALFLFWVLWAADAEKLPTVIITVGFSKIFEIYRCKHLRNYLTSKDVTSEQLWGFMSGLSTDIPIRKLLMHVYDGLDSYEHG